MGCGRRNQRSQATLGLSGSALAQCHTQPGRNSLAQRQPGCCLACLGRRGGVQRAWIAPGMTGVQTEPGSCGGVQKILFSTPRGNRNTRKPPLRTNPTTDCASWEMWMQQVSREKPKHKFLAQSRCELQSLAAGFPPRLCSQPGKGQHAACFRIPKYCPTGRALNRAHPTRCIPCAAKSHQEEGCASGDQVEIRV